MKEVTISIKAWIDLVDYCNHNDARIYQTLREEYGLERFQPDRLRVTGSLVHFRVIDESKYLFFKLKYE